MCKRPLQSTAYTTPRGVDRVREKSLDNRHFFGVALHEDKGDQARGALMSQCNADLSAMGWQTGEINHDRSRRVIFQFAQEIRPARQLPGHVMTQSNETLGALFGFVLVPVDELNAAHQEILGCPVID